MAEILVLSDSADHFFERGMEKIDRGQMIDAIDDFYAALKREPGSFWMLTETAYCYMSLGLLKHAERIYMRMLSYEKRVEPGYLGLIQCNLKWNKPAVALYYVTMALKYGAISRDFYGPEIKHVEDLAAKRKFNVLQGEQGGNLVQMAKKLMAGGDNEYARQMLETVPEGSEQYAEAQNALALLALGENKNEEAARLCEEAIKRNPKDAVALSAAVLAYKSLGQTERMEELATALDDADVSGRDSLHRAAVTFMQLDDCRKCVRYFGKLLELVPYDRDYLLAYSLALFDCGEKALAKKHMLDARRLFPEDCTVGYYARLFAEPQITHIPVSFDLPAGEKLRRLHRIEEAFSELKDIDRVVKRLAKDEELTDMVMWLLWSEEAVMAERVAVFLCQHEDWQPVIRRMLVDPAISMSLKKECLLALLRYAKNKKFALNSGDLLTFQNGYIPKCDDTPDMREAYITAYATYSFLCVEFRDKLMRVYKKFVGIMSAPGFEPFKIRPATMAALLAYSVKVHAVMSRTDSVCEIFGCDREEFLSYARALKVDCRHEPEDESELDEEFEPEGGEE